MLLSYLARRLALAIVALFGVVLVAFLVAHMVPADPLAVVLSDQATKDPSIRAAYVKRWGLDRSLPEQFGAYLANVLRGDLGESFTTRRPVLRDLAQFMPATVELSLAALAVSLVFGIPLGVWAAVRHNRAPDHATRVVALVGAASPIFWTGLIALYVFYYLLEWAPGPGRLDTHISYPPRVTGFLLVDSLLAGQGEVLRVRPPAHRAAGAGPRLVHHGHRLPHHAGGGPRGAGDGVRRARRGRRGWGRRWSSALTPSGTR